MNKQIMKQATTLMKQNRFYSIVSILGTAVSIAFVMGVYMVYAGVATLGMIMLVVPAINISGLISSQMTHRLSEIGIRKAYGASSRGLIAQLLTENLFLAVIGAIGGLVLSCLLIYLTKDWLLVSADHLESLEQHRISIFLFLRPRVFLYVFAICLLFNLMSVFIPAWNATRRSIIRNNYPYDKEK